MTLSLRQPTRRYTRAWITQRLVNRAPEWTRARSSPYSIAQQLFNPIGLEIQNTIKGLVEERYNMFLSTANPFLMDKVFEAELPQGMYFNTTEDSDGILIYSPPSVYAIINGSEEQIFQAENNNIETFWYDCLPTRVEYGEESHTYNDIVSNILISDLSDTLLGNLVLPGHLYITVSGNTSWQEESKDRTYYSKIIIEGTLRKDVEDVVEAVPIRYNSTFRTLNQWQEITQVTSAYLSDDAHITISPLPFAATCELDKRNINILSEGDERMQFIALTDKDWGTALSVESFTSSDMDAIRLGFEQKEPAYEMELLNDEGNNVELNAATIYPGTDLLYAINDNTLYIYDINLPYADTENLANASTDSKMELGSDKWSYVRDETAKLWTRIFSFSEVPNSSRWTLVLPNGSSYYMDLSGTILGADADAWIPNPNWDKGTWKDPAINLTLDQVGTYTIQLECKYYDEKSQESTIRSTKIVLLVAAIQPEQQISLPAELQNCINIAFDSDGKLWFYDGISIYLANLYFDYFMADYERRKIILREEYSQVRIVI